MALMLSELVGDWGGFEELIRTMHQTGSVDVQRNVALKGRSGAIRQIDVLITHREGLYEHKIIAECKHWSKSISRIHVDALATTIREVGAAKGVIFSVKGFQKGAITQATHEGISLFKVRDLTPEEWGLPGRFIDFWMHIIGVSFGNLRFHEPISFAGYEPNDSLLALNLEKIGRSFTPINPNNPAERTLEDLIENQVKVAAKRMYRPVIYRSDDSLKSEDTYIQGKSMVHIRSERGIVALHSGGVIVFRDIFCDVCIDILQSRVKIDRGNDSLFVFAVEDCISNNIHSVQRRIGDDVTSVSILELRSAEQEQEPFQNGSLMQIWTAGYQDFSKYESLPRGQIRIIDRNKEI